MAVFTDPIDFVSLYGADGLGLIVNVRDGTTDTAGRRNAVNRAYLELAAIKGFWRRRSNTITLTAGTVAYNVPADFDLPLRLYYRQVGRMHDVDFLSDSDWLEWSATRTTDAGDPRWARLTQTSATQKQIELTPPPSQSFIDTTSSTLTIEYWIQLTLLSADTDVPILPPNLRHHILPLAGYYYAQAQGDWALVDRLAKEAELARAAVLKHDLTRTGRPRQVRPRKGYAAHSGAGGYDYGERF